MNCTQNRKIEQVTEQILVIGMDIAKHKHYAAMVDERGRELKKPFPVFQSRIGFEQFYVSIEEAKENLARRRSSSVWNRPGITGCTSPISSRKDPIGDGQPDARQTVERARRQLTKRSTMPKMPSLSPD